MRLMPVGSMNTLCAINLIGIHWMMSDCPKYVVIRILNINGSYPFTPRPTPWCVAAAAAAVNDLVWAGAFNNKSHTIKWTTHWVCRRIAHKLCVRRQWNRLHSMAIQVECASVIKAKVSLRRQVPVSFVSLFCRSENPFIDWIIWPKIYHNVT